MLSSLILALKRLRQEGHKFEVTVWAKEQVLSLLRLSQNKSPVLGREKGNQVVLDIEKLLPPNLRFLPNIKEKSYYRREEDSHLKCVFRLQVCTAV